MRRGVFKLTLLLPHFLPGGLLAHNAFFTARFDGPCGETIVGPAGSTYDDGTGGRDFFFDRAAYVADENGDGSYDRVEVPNNRPGHTWNVVLNASDNPHDWGVCGWAFGVGIDGPLRITDATTSGTAGCQIGRGPTCLQGAGFELTAITGPPNGEGPQTKENAGAVCTVILKPDCGFQLPPEGDSVICKIRVSGEFPPTVGDVAVGRVYFAGRTYATGSMPVFYLNASGDVTPEEGDPPMTVEACEFRLRAVSPVTPFVRCDLNDDGTVDISDAVWSFQVLFRGGTPKPCRAAGDCNGDGVWDISDGIYALQHLFLGGPPPPAPYPKCGSGVGVLPEDCPFGSTRCPP
jgi:hypothetical protein